MNHRIQDIHFVPRSDDGEMTCTCGDGMLASEFADHRKSNGLTYGQLRVPESEKLKPSVWNRIRR